VVVISRVAGWPGIMGISRSRLILAIGYEPDSVAIGARMDRQQTRWQERFPRAAEYDLDWVLENQMGPNALWLTEFLVNEMELVPGMRVLDLGCGKALSSVFLAREWGVRVWAADLWIAPTENWARVCEAGLENLVYPVYTEAHTLPFAHGFFDAIVAVDSYAYFGTDDLYLGYLKDFVKPGGQIGVVVPGLMQEFENGVPEHLTRRQESGGVFWGPDCWSYHTSEWWRTHWQRTELVDVECADTLPDGAELWLHWDRVVQASGRAHFPSDEETLVADGGRYLGFLRMIARRAVE